MKVLAIETSCDETAASVVTDENKPGASWVLSSVVASQDDIHKRYGGVVPELASRRHIEQLPLVVAEAMKKAGIRCDEIDAVAVTAQPGLIAALWVGVAYAKALAFSLSKPLITVHHLAAHLAAVLLDGEPCPWPHLALLVSGGHSNLYWGESQRGYKLLGTTQDDAAGEAFDKVAKVLGLGYPGGREIERLAATVSVPVDLALPLPRLKSGAYGFSFSGLKTAVAQRLQQQPQTPGAHVAFAFQERVMDHLSDQVHRAIEEFRPRALILAGGVAANGRLRAGFKALCERTGIEFHVPRTQWCTDNAAMIGALGILKHRAGVHAGWDACAQPYEQSRIDFDPEFFPV